MSDGKDSVNPGAPDEKQSSATPPRPEARNGAELTDSELDAVAGGAGQDHNRSIKDPIRKNIDQLAELNRNV